MKLTRYSVKLGYLQGLFFSQTARLCEQGLSIDGQLYPYPDLVKRVEIEQGVFIRTLVWGENRFYFFRSITTHSLFEHAVSNRMLFWKSDYLAIFEELVNNIDKFDRQISQHPGYLRHSDRVLLTTKYQANSTLFKLIKYFTQLDFDVSQLHCNLAKFIKHPKQFTDKYNQWWLNNQLTDHQALFDTLEDNPLTLLQRQACIIDENNTLVIAGAGTGKTSTMAAKAAYLVKQGLAKPDEILMLAYGKDARVELALHVNRKVGLEKVKVSTFHALGKEIIQCYSQQSTQVSLLATDEKRFTQFVDEQVDAIVADPNMADPIADYFGRYLYPQVNELDFTTHGQYLHYLKNNEIRALSGDLVSSFQELIICNYLYTHGIKFEYEPRYRFLVSEPSKKVYQPDFYIPALDAYLEHFGIDKQGNTHVDIDNEAYTKSREWKIAVHKEHNTHLLQTFSWQADKGILEQSLEALLCQRCEALDLAQHNFFKPISPEQVFTQVKNLGVYRNVSRLMSSFLTLFKGSEFMLQDLTFMKVKAGNGKTTMPYNQLRWEAFLYLFNGVVDRYEQQLKLHNTFDFSDMISQAIKITETVNFYEKTAECFRFKYIMIDEFQDISAERAKLVTQLRDSSVGCALFCVGDDWQAIYRFTGSDLKFTTHFEETFGATKVVTLDKTFRFNDRIEKVASGFIQVNPAQRTKKLTTQNISVNPEVHLLVNTKQAALQQAFEHIISLVGSNKATVMVISRFKTSLKELTTWKKHYTQLDISGLSAHSSKGKQADFVIVIDVNDDKFGFPCKIDNDPILDTLLPPLDGYAYTEERRLFYVALSRAKKSVFIHAELGKESIFVKELRTLDIEIHSGTNHLASLYFESLVCPKCKEGKLIPLEGRYGVFYACSLGRDYCDTRIEVCPSCKSAPILRNKTHHFCVAKKCDATFEVCPDCLSGKLIERANSKSGQVFWACSLHRRDDSHSCQYTCSSHKKQHELAPCADK